MADDLAARSVCVSAGWTPQQRLHVGDLAWSGCGGDGSPAPDLTLAWGEPLVAFADVWRGGSGDEASLHVSPNASGELRRALLAELLAVAPVLTVEVSRQDTVLVAQLAAAGFGEAGGPWFAALWRDLRDVGDLDRHQPGHGYVIRTVRPGEDDVTARVEVHRRAWAPARIKGLLGLQVTGDEGGSSYSLATHRALMATPTYRTALDLVAVDDRGEVAAYALGWLDDDTGSLLFEPVGTDPAHSGRGLARALCAQLMRSARELGATEAVVRPRGDPAYPVPRRVYEGLGLREVGQLVTMTNT